MTGLLTAVEQPTMAAADALRFKTDPVDSGAFRDVYHDGVSYWAYKIEDSDMWEFAETETVREYENYLRLKDRLPPSGVRFPEMVLLSPDVIAVQWIEGEHPVYHFKSECGDHCRVAISGDCWLVAKRTVDIMDDHCKNFIFSKDRFLYAIDLSY